MTTTKGKDIIDGGWKAPGIFDAIKLGSEKMPSIDPFRDIDPMLGDDDRQADDNSHLLAVCDVTVEDFELLCGSKIQRYIAEDRETDDETDSEWEVEENLLYFFSLNKTEEIIKIKNKSYFFCLAAKVFFTQK